MKATDLRIGNYVIFKNIQMVTLNQNGKYENYEEPHQLHQIQISSNDFEYIEKGQLEYRPIPLTEEWLLKFGFEKRTTVAHSVQYFIGFNPITHDWMFDILWLVGHEYPFYRNGHFAIKYVHQLQNLTFALTGEELTIKENEI
jgi:hypothetical protein